MNYQEMKASHEVQIDAMLAGDYKAINTLFPLAGYVGCHYDVWVGTGGARDSLFGMLPGTMTCLTIAKGHMGAAAQTWCAKLGLATNDLIPKFVEEVTVFTREQLEEFSRLQLLVNFPEGDVD